MVLKEGGRIVSNSAAKVVQQTFQAKLPANLQSKRRVNNTIFMTMQQLQHRPTSSQTRVARSTIYPYADIFERLRENGLLQSRKGFISGYMPEDFDLSKNCSYHSNIQGDDTEDCPALKFKIQYMIESGNLKLQMDPSTNNGNIANTTTIVVKDNPSKLAPPHLKRKRATSQKD
ncbi:hypothetical protein KY290_036634 [Solanum tuberosum]|uniref:Uncharacterized protein n=1 Tax=Solanum tuberosum TaxID=4113 RepID=A0ABQ7TV25_SOLTU|nr:hypothetical protein KY289_036115 [Solanum tuberosum]KAH0639371.1 hypothetical protein KY285_035957 [Solanum tuberosum]KAH0737929.1 hypothetical protein KY290_036634 [Solanum tuberosum]